MGKKKTTNRTESSISPTEVQKMQSDWEKLIRRWKANLTAADRLNIEIPFLLGNARLEKYIEVRFDNLSQDSITRLQRELKTHLSALQSLEKSIHQEAIRTKSLTISKPASLKKTDQKVSPLEIGLKPETPAIEITPQEAAERLDIILGLFQIPPGLWTPNDHSEWDAIWAEASLLRKKFDEERYEELLKRMQKFCDDRGIKPEGYPFKQLEVKKEAEQDVEKLTAATSSKISGGIDINLLGDDGDLKEELKPSPVETPISRADIKLRISKEFANEKIIWEMEDAVFKRLKTLVPNYQQWRNLWTTTKQRLESAQIGEQKRNQIFAAITHGACVHYLTKRFGLEEHKQLAIEYAKRLENGIRESFVEYIEAIELREQKQKEPEVVMPQQEQAGLFEKVFEGFADYFVNDFDKIVEQARVNFPNDEKSDKLSLWNLLYWLLENSEFRKKAYRRLFSKNSEFKKKFEELHPVQQSPLEVEQVENKIFEEPKAEQHKPSEPPLRVENVAAVDTSAGGRVKTPTPEIEAKEILVDSFMPEEATKEIKNLLGDSIEFGGVTFEIEQCKIDKSSKLDELSFTLRTKAFKLSVEVSGTFCNQGEGISVKDDKTLIVHIVKPKGLAARAAFPAALKAAEWAIAGILKVKKIDLDITLTDEGLRSLIVKFRDQMHSTMITNIHKSEKYKNPPDYARIKNGRLELMRVGKET